MQTLLSSKNKKILWIGVDQHSPRVCPLRQYRGINLHSHSNIGQIDFNDITMSDLSEITIYENQLYIGSNQIPLNNYRALFLTWNYFYLHKNINALTKLSTIEEICKKNALQIVNSTRQSKFLAEKSSFFNYLKPYLADVLPEYIYPVRLSNLFRLPPPLLFRSNTSTGGQDTHIINSKIDLLSSYFKKNFIDPIIVNLYNTSQNNLHVTYRALLTNGKLNFAFPKISRTPIATAHLTCDITKNDFIKISQKSIHIAYKYRNIFKKVSTLIGINNLAIDFLEYNGNLVLLEGELKYGPDDVYTCETLPHFAMSLDDIIDNIPVELLEKCNQSDIFIMN